MILMITVALASLGYIFFTGTFSSLTNITQASVNQSTMGIGSSFKIESINGNQIYIRNTGQTTIGNFSVYINDNPVVSTPLTLAPGQLGYVSITYTGDGTKTVRIISNTGYEATITNTFQFCSYPGVIACYHLDEGSGTVSADTVGGYNLNLFNTLWTAGKSGNALSFNGANAYAISSNIAAINNGNPFSIALWFNANSPGVILDELGQTTINTGWHDSWIEITSGGIVKVRVWGVSAATAGTASFGTWNHVVLVYSNGVLTGYLNGVAGTPVTGTRSYNGYGEYIALGPTDSTNLGSGAWFNGVIDEVRIFNRALSASEIASMIY